MADIASEGFSPVAGADARVLILGSLPGERSIAAQQYYAHPRNAFWKIMNQVFGIGGTYASRCAQLIQHRIALWDVLERSIRPGSMDANIRTDTAKANELPGFLLSHRSVCQVVFNGRKAEQLFYRFVDTDALDPSIALTGLPSTSPAYAAMPFSEKCERWTEALATVFHEARG